MIRLQNASKKFDCCAYTIAHKGLSRAAAIWRKWFSFVTLIFNSSSIFEKLLISSVQYSTIEFFFLYFNQKCCGYVFQIYVSNELSTLQVFTLDMICSNLADRKELIIKTRYNTTLFPAKVLLTMLMCLSTLFPRVHRQVWGRPEFFVELYGSFCQMVFADHEIALSYFSVLNKSHFGISISALRTTGFVFIYANKNEKL